MVLKSQRLKHTHDVWKSQKKSHWTLRAKKTNQECQKYFILASFWKPEACGQKLLPDKSLSKEQKLVGNGKIDIFKCDILSNFQTMWQGFFFYIFRKNEFWIFGNDFETFMA